MQYAVALPHAGANHGFRLRALGNERLAVLAAAGDAGAFGVLYERHHAALYRYCNSILRQHDDAEDAAQSTMTRALAALERRDPDAAWSAWLFRIAHNESIDRLRARRRFDELGEADGAGVVALEPHIEHRERLRSTLRDLGDLPERQRSSLVMRELGGLSDEEIGSALSISPGGVRQAVFEARTALNDFAAGRALACSVVRGAIARGDGRRLRARPVRAHLRSCGECAAYRDFSRARRRARAGWSLPLWLSELLARIPGGAHEAVAGALVVTLGAGLAEQGLTGHLYPAGRLSAHPPAAAAPAHPRVAPPLATTPEAPAAARRSVAPASAAPPRTPAGSPATPRVSGRPAVTRGPSGRAAQPPRAHHPVPAAHPSPPPAPPATAPQAAASPPPAADAAPPPGADPQAPPVARPPAAPAAERPASAPPAQASAPDRGAASFAPGRGGTPPGHGGVSPGHAKSGV